MSDEEFNRRRDDHWHIGKTLDVGHLITTLLLVIGGVMYVSRLDTRITVLEANLQIQTEMRQDIKDIKDTIGALPEFVRRKEETDRDQWREIRDLKGK